MSRPFRTAFDWGTIYFAYVGNGITRIGADHAHASPFAWGNGPSWAHRVAVKLAVSLPLFRD